MIQFYFLSILLNFISGYTICIDAEDRSGTLEGLRELLRNDTVRLVLGILTILIGLFKLLSTVRGDVPVVGDLFPALAGLLAGFILVFEFYRSKTTLHVQLPEPLHLIFVNNRRWVGIGAMCTAAAHFLFPTVLFL